MVRIVRSQEIDLTLPDESVATDFQAAALAQLNSRQQGGFARAASEFLNKIGLLETVRPGSPNASPAARSGINQQELHALAVTSDDEWNLMLGQTREASKIWMRVPPEERAEFFQVLKSKMNSHQELFRTILAIDVGKCLKDGSGELKKAGDWFDWVGREDILDQARSDRTITYYDKDNHVVRGPEAITSADQVPEDGYERVAIHGPQQGRTTMVMTSYNYPIALSMAGIVSALMAGNSVAFKCSSKAPHWAFAFQSVFDEALREWGKDKLDQRDLEKLRSDLFRVAVGKDRNSGADITAQENFRKNVDHVFFVGRSSVFKNDILEGRDGKPSTGELGGNSMTAVMTSAVEGGEAAKVAAAVYTAGSSMAGQRCTKAALLAVQAGTDDATKKGAKDFLDALQELYQQPNPAIGNPFDGEVSTGALVNKSDYDAMVKAVARAKELGAVSMGRADGKIDVDNPNKKPPVGGYYVYPQLFDWRNVDLTDEVVEFLRQETFAPITHLLREVDGPAQAADLQLKCDHERLAAGFFGTEQEFNIFSSIARAGTISRGMGPKDHSPDRPHGNVDEAGNWLYGASGGEEGVKQYLPNSMSTVHREGRETTSDLRNKVLAALNFGPTQGISIH